MLAVQAQREYPEMATLFPETEATAPAVLNVEAALERLQGHREIYLALLQTFVTNKRGDVQKLVAALEAGRSAEARRLAHSMRGAAAILGAEQLAAKAAQTEQQLRGEAAQQLDIASLIRPLDEALAEALAAAGQVLANE